MADGTVAVEDGIADEVVQRLREMGHQIAVVKGHKRAVFGRGQVIALRVQHADVNSENSKRDCSSSALLNGKQKVVTVNNHVLVGGSDGRADGCAMAAL